VRKYALRLLVFAVISEIPYDAAVFNTYFDFRQQNIFFDLFLGLCMLICLKKAGNHRASLQIYIILIFCCIASLCHAGYNIIGILFIASIYLIYDKNRIMGILAGSTVQVYCITAPFSFLFIQKYNGQRGLSLKYLFYIIYPVHLVIFYFIAKSISY